MSLPPPGQFFVRDQLPVKVLPSPEVASSPGVVSPTGVIPSPGVVSPTGVLPSPGVTSPTGVTSPGVPSPTGVLSPTGVTSPGVLSPTEVTSLGVASQTGVLPSTGPSSPGVASPGVPLGDILHPSEPVVQLPSTGILPSTEPTLELPPSEPVVQLPSTGILPSTEPTLEFPPSEPVVQSSSAVGQPLTGLSPVELIGLDESRSPIDSTLEVLEAPPGPQDVQNPYLDEYQPPVGGKMSIQGQPLNRIMVPEIPTLVAKPTISIEALPLVESTVVPVATISSVQSGVVQSETSGIEINPNLFGESSIPQVGEKNPAEIASEHQVLPTNFQEAKEKLHLITGQRSGRNNQAYGINEIRQIAKNLHLPSSGNKGPIANRIRAAVIEYFDMQ